MVFDANFNNISVILWRQFYWWKKPEYPKKTTDLCINIFICVFVPKFQNFRDCVLLIVGDTTMTEMQHNIKSAVPLFEFVFKCNVK